jgi:hypothetical protein
MCRWSLMIRPWELGSIRPMLALMSVLTQIHPMLALEGIHPMLVLKGIHSMLVLEEIHPMLVLEENHSMPVLGENHLRFRPHYRHPRAGIQSSSLRDLGYQLR